MTDVPPFVDAAWLADHPDAVVCDVRSYLDGRRGADAYAAGHLPGAVFVDLDAVLAGPPSPERGRHPLPTPEVFAAGLGGLGIGADNLVVAYDDDHGAMASRLVWLLRLLGCRAALLDGGFTGWRGPVFTAPVTRAPVERAAVPWPAHALVTLEEAADAAARGDLVDARPGPRFRGEVEPIDVRAGHVPGARNVPCREHADGQGRLLPDDVLRDRLGPLAPGWVACCGSGVTACLNLLVAQRLGLPDGRLWPGSWSEWAATDRPAGLG